MAAISVLESDRLPDTRTQFPEVQRNGPALARMANMKCRGIKTFITGQSAAYAQRTHKPKRPLSDQGATVLVE